MAGRKFTQFPLFSGAPSGSLQIFIFDPSAAAEIDRNKRISVSDLLAALSGGRVISALGLPAVAAANRGKVLGRAQGGETLEWVDASSGGGTADGVLESATFTAATRVLTLGRSGGLEDLTVTIPGGGTGGTMTGAEIIDAINAETSKQIGEPRIVAAIARDSEVTTLIAAVRQVPSGGTDGQFLGHSGGSPAWVAAPSGGGDGGTGGDITEQSFATHFADGDGTVTEAWEALEFASGDVTVDEGTFTVASNKVAVGVAGRYLATAHVVASVAAVAAANDRARLRVRLAVTSNGTTTASDVIGGSYARNQYPGFYELASSVTELLDLAVGDEVEVQVFAEEQDTSNAVTIDGSGCTLALARQGVGTPAPPAPAMSEQTFVTAFADGDGSVTTAWETLEFGSGDVTVDEGTFTVASNKVAVSEAGRYLVNAHARALVAAVSAASDRARLRVRIAVTSAGTTTASDVVGGSYARNQYPGFYELTSAVTEIRDLASGDEVEVQVLAEEQDTSNDVTIDGSGSQLSVALLGGITGPAGDGGDGAALPAVTGSDDGKVLKVASGAWAAGTDETGLATVTRSGNTLGGDGTSGSGLKVADGGVGTTQLAAGAVTTAKVGDDQVTAAKIADDVVERLLPAPTDDSTDSGKVAALTADGTAYELATVATGGGGAKGDKGDTGETGPQGAPGDADSTTGYTYHRHIDLTFTAITSATASAASHEETVYSATMPGGITPGNDFVSEWEGAFHINVDTGGNYVVSMILEHDFGSNRRIVASRKYALRLGRSEEATVPLPAFNSRSQVPTGEWTDPQGNTVTFTDADFANDVDIVVKLKVERANGASFAIDAASLDDGAATFWQIGSAAVRFPAPTDDSDDAGKVVVLNDDGDAYELSTRVEDLDAVNAALEALHEKTSHIRDHQINRTVVNPTGVQVVTPTISSGEIGDTALQALTGWANVPTETTRSTRHGLVLRTADSADVLRHPRVLVTDGGTRVRTLTGFRDRGILGSHRYYVWVDYIDAAEGAAETTIGAFDELSVDSQTTDEIPEWDGDIVGGRIVSALDGLTGNSKLPASAIRGLVSAINAETGTIDRARLTAIVDADIPASITRDAEVAALIAAVRQLPAVSASDNGKVLKVVQGAWAKGDDETGAGGDGGADGVVNAASFNTVSRVLRLGRSGTLADVTATIPADKGARTATDAAAENRAIIDEVVNPVPVIGSFSDITEEDHRALWGVAEAGSRPANGPGGGYLRSVTSGSGAKVIMIECPRGTDPATHARVRKGSTVYPLAGQHWQEWAPGASNHNARYYYLANDSDDSEVFLTGISQTYVMQRARVTGYTHELDPESIGQDGASEGDTLTWSDSQGAWVPAEGGGGSGAVLELMGTVAAPTNQQRWHDTGIALPLPQPDGEMWAMGIGDDIVFFDPARLYAAGSTGHAVAHATVGAALNAQSYAHFVEIQNLLGSTVTSFEARLHLGVSGGPIPQGTLVTPPGGNILLIMSQSGQLPYPVPFYRLAITPGSRLLPPGGMEGQSLGHDADGPVWESPAEALAADPNPVTLPAIFVKSAVRHVGWDRYALPPELQVIHTDSNLGYQAATGRVQLGRGGYSRAILAHNDALGLINPEDVFLQVLLDWSHNTEWGFALYLGTDEPQSNQDAFTTRTGGIVLAVQTWNGKVIMLNAGQDNGGGETTWAQNVAPEAAGSWTDVVGPDVRRLTTAEAGNTRSRNANLQLSGRGLPAHGVTTHVGVEHFGRSTHFYLGGLHQATWTWADAFLPFRDGRRGSWYGIAGNPGFARYVDGVQIHPTMWCNKLGLTPARRGAPDGTFL